MSLRSRRGTARDIQASDPRSGSAEVTQTCKVGGQQPRLVAAHRKPLTYCEPLCPAHLCAAFSEFGWCSFERNTD